MNRQEKIKYLQALMNGEKITRPDEIQIYISIDNGQTYKEISTGRTFTKEKLKNKPLTLKINHHDINIFGKI